MASIPMDQGGRKRGGKPPVSAHPAFPAIVALWFAALLGLGSLILPVQLIESLVTATGIASIFPSAAPPLGFTARAAIALIATVAGALLGLFAARKVAKPRTPSLDTTWRDAGRRPLDPVEDFEEDSFDAELPPVRDAGPRIFGTREPDPTANRRRALAIELDEGPSELLAAPRLATPDAYGTQEDEELELGEADEVVDDDASDMEAAELQKPIAEPVPPVEFEQRRQEFEPASTAQEPPEDEIAALKNDAQDGARFQFTERHADPEAEAPRGEPLSFSPPSLARQPEAPRPFDAPPAQPPESSAADESDETSEEYVSEKQIFQAPAASEKPADSASTPSQSPAIPQAFEPDATEEEPYRDPEPPAENAEGLVQLVQRLGQTIEKRREWAEQRAAETPSPASTQAAAPVPQEFEAAGADDAAQAMAAFFDKPSASAPPVTVKPHIPGKTYAPFAGASPLAEPSAQDLEDEDEDEELDDLAASFSLPISSGGATPMQSHPTPRPSFDIAPRQAEPQDERATREIADSPASDAAYGSLSAVANPFKRNAQDFVRIDEPEPEPDSTQPAVQFPSDEVRKPQPVAEDRSANGSATPARAFDPPTGASPRGSNDDNERALREALVNLQRMSK